MFVGVSWCTTPLSASVFTPPSSVPLCVSLTQTLVLGFRSRLGNPKGSHVEILNSITSPKLFSPNKVMIQVLEIRTWTDLFKDHHSTH